MSLTEWITSVAKRLPDAMRPASGTSTVAIHDDEESALPLNATNTDLFTADEDDDDEEEFYGDNDVTVDFSMCEFIVPFVEHVRFREFEFRSEDVSILRLRDYKLSDLQIEDRTVRILMDDSQFTRDDIEECWFAISHNRMDLFDMFLRQFYCTKIPRDLRATLEVIDECYRIVPRIDALSATAPYGSRCEDPSVFDARLRRSAQAQRETSNCNVAVLSSMEILIDVLARFSKTTVVSKQMISIFCYWMKTGGANEASVRHSERETAQAIASLEMALAHANGALKSISLL